MKQILWAFLFISSVLSAEIETEGRPEQYPNHVPTGERALSKEEYYIQQKERIELEEEGEQKELDKNTETFAPKRIIKSQKSLFGKKLKQLMRGFTVYGKYHTYYSSHESAFHSPLSISRKGDTVEIEDGSIWSIKYSDRYKTLNWLNGDILIIVPNGEWLSSYRYKIVNINTGVTVRSNLTLKPLYNGVYTHWITGIDHLNRLVYLDDGSCWSLPWYEQGVLSRWLLDDTVIIGTNDGLFTSDSLPNIIINTSTEDYVLGNCLN
ncbi:MAG: hypothetical protein WD595_01895 [Waddliaceae bacterium]